MHTFVREICYGTNDAGQQRSGTSHLYAVFVDDIRRSSSVVGPPLMTFHVIVYLAQCALCDTAKAELDYNE